MRNNPTNYLNPLGHDVFFNQENEIGGHAWTKIGGDSPTGGSSTFGAFNDGHLFGKPEVVLNPDPHTDDDDFTYQRYKTTPQDEAALEKWIRDHYDINDFDSRKNPNYNLGFEDCRSFRNRLRAELEKIIKARGGAIQTSGGSVPAATIP